MPTNFKNKICCDELQQEIGNLPCTPTNKIRQNRENREA